MKSVFLFLIAIFCCCFAHAQTLLPISTACPGQYWEDIYWGNNNYYYFFQGQSKRAVKGLEIKSDAVFFVKKINDTLFKIRPLSIGVKTLWVKTSEGMDSVVLNRKYCDLIFSTYAKRDQSMQGLMDYRIKGLFIVNETAACNSCADGYKILRYELFAKRDDQVIGAGNDFTAFKTQLIPGDSLFAGNVRIRTRTGFEYTIEKQLINVLREGTSSH